MEPFFVKVLATLVKSVAGPVLRWFKPLSAEKSAAEAPEKLKTIDQSVFDGVLRRLAAADPADSIFMRMYNAATNKCFTPDYLRTPNVQNWLEKQNVRADLRTVATAKLFDLPAPQIALARLESQYGEVAYANSQESALVVASITTLDDGKYIVRPELDQLLEITQSSKRGTIALLGVPGSGKSALLARLGQEFATKSHIAVLAIKGDLLDASVATEEDLQRDLLLPALPCTMLRRLAGPVVLLIDQLDALAGHLDTKTGRLSVPLNLVKVVCEIQGLHVFVSCRTFEFTHDIRLSRIDAECVRLELPAREQVLTILEARGVKAGGWNSDGAASPAADTDHQAG